MSSPACWVRDCESAVRWGFSIDRLVRPGTFVTQLRLGLILLGPPAFFSNWTFVPVDNTERKCRCDLCQRKFRVVQRRGVRGQPQNSEVSFCCNHHLLVLGQIGKSSGSQFVLGDPKFGRRVNRLPYGVSSGHDFEKFFGGPNASLGGLLFSSGKTSFLFLFAD